MLLLLMKQEWYSRRDLLSVGLDDIALLVLHRCIIQHTSEVLGSFKVH